MKRKLIVCTLLLTLAVQPVLGVFSGPGIVRAANSTAVIDFNTSQETAIERGMRGMNNEMQKSAMDFLDDDFAGEIKAAKQGWLRWPGGTNTGNFNWKLGEPDDEAVAQYYPNQNYPTFDLNRRLTIAKGQEKLKDFYELRCPKPKSLVKDILS
ncbi:MAG: hypothetical protein K0S39_3235 [Paenibacillus sp.]|jgi:hypothetical protein|nr:hypothetical protein [Paenibacillus sp.]